jgi:hypothetical protein
MVTPPGLRITPKVQNVAIENTNSEDSANQASQGENCPPSESESSQNSVIYLDL